MFLAWRAEAGKEGVYQIGSPVCNKYRRRASSWEDKIRTINGYPTFSHLI
jgi:hypothetical protein